MIIAIKNMRRFAAAVECTADNSRRPLNCVLITPGGTVVGTNSELLLVVPKTVEKFDGGPVLICLKSKITAALLRCSSAVIDTETKVMTMQSVKGIVYCVALTFENDYRFPDWQELVGSMKPDASATLPYFKVRDAANVISKLGAEIVTATVSEGKVIIWKIRGMEDIDLYQAIGRT